MSVNTLILLTSSLVMIRSQQFQPLSNADIASLEEELSAAYNDAALCPNNCDGGPMFFDPLAATVLRLSFHDCGGPREGNQNPNTFDSICDGCIQVNDFADHSDLETRAIMPLETIFKGEWEFKMTRADFWAFAATVAIKHTHNNAANGDTLPVIQHFFGRKDCSTTPDVDASITTHKTFPAGIFGWKETFEWLRDNMGFTARETVVILGAHTLGTPHRDDSGFTIGGSIAPWVSSWGFFDNQFYIELREAASKWVQVDAVNGQKLWRGNTFGMRLNTDMGLFIDIDNHDANGAVSCGAPPNDFTTCPRNNVAAGFVDEFAQSNQAFLDAFVAAYIKMITQGYIINGNQLIPKPTASPTPSPTALPTPSGGVCDNMPSKPGAVSSYTQCTDENGCIYVDSTSQCQSGCGSANNAYRTLESAINAGHWKTIIVKAGIYSGFGNYNIIKQHVGLKIFSEYGSDQTIIDCQGYGGFALEHGSLSMQGFTIKNCVGLHQSAGGFSGRLGGAFYLRHFSASFTDMIIRENTADYGGAIFINEGAVSLHNSILYKNCAIKSDDDIKTVIATVSLGNSILSCNQCDNIGAGLIANNIWDLSQSPWIYMVFGGLLALLLIINIVCLSKKRKNGLYGIVKYVDDSEDYNDSEANPINID